MGPTATEKQFPCQTLVACLVQDQPRARAGGQHPILSGGALPTTAAVGPPTAARLSNPSDASATAAQRWTGRSEDSGGSGERGGCDLIKKQINANQR